MKGREFLLFQINTLAEGRSWSEETSSARNYSPPTQDFEQDQIKKINFSKSKAGGSDMEAYYGMSKLVENYNTFN